MGKGLGGRALGPSPVPGSPPAPEPPLPPRALQRTVRMMRRPLRRAARTEVSTRRRGDEPDGDVPLAAAVVLPLPRARPRL